MTIVAQLIFIVLGVVCVLRGADRMTEGAVALARQLHISEMVIGLTIVAAGTSAPELFVSVVSAVNGTPDMAVGNVVGSNTLNTMLIVGVAAMVAPLSISRSTVRVDMPFASVAALLLVVLCLDAFDHLSFSGNSLSRTDGALLLGVFAVFMYTTLRTARKGQPAGAADSSARQQAQSAADAASSAAMPAWRGLLFIVFGLALLLVGSNVFVNAATQVARLLGVSDGVIGLTVVAGGTSLPELATTVVAARKGQSAIAIGNVIGSCVFNVLLILGLTAAIQPMLIEGITLADLLVALLSMLLLWLFSATKLAVARWEGALLVLGYLAYLCWLISQL